MTPEQFVAVMGAFTALLLAVGTIYVQLRQTHAAVNGRLTQLLELTATSAHAEGVLAEQVAPSAPADTPPLPRIGVIRDAGMASDTEKPS